MLAPNPPTANLLHLAALLPPKDSPLCDAALFASRPLEFLQMVMQLSGDLAYVPLTDAADPTSSPTVIPIHPNLVKQVLTNTRAFRKPAQSALGRYLFGDGLVTSGGDQWKRQRQTLQPAFHREALAAIGSVVTGATEEILAGWKPGQVIDAAAEMTRLTLRILGKTLFGRDFTSETDSIGQAITTLLSCVHEPGQHTPSEAEAALLTLEALVFQLLIERRVSQRDESDLLSLLLQAQQDDPAFFTDQLVRDEVMTFLIAGHETTAVALAWALYFLAQHAEVEHTLRTHLAEVLGGHIPSIADLPRLSYARMVLEEAMRLRPPVWATSRETALATELGGYFLPAGTPVLVTPYLTHRHPAFWRAPEQFYPPRFCAQRAARHRFAYVPFGGGPRQCIGADFALTEAILILAMIAQRYRLQLLAGFSAEPEPLMTLRIRGGLPVLVQAVA